MGWLTLDSSFSLISLTPIAVVSFSRSRSLLILTAHTSYYYYSIYYNGQYDPSNFAYTSELIVNHESRHPRFCRVSATNWILRILRIFSCRYPKGNDRKWTYNPSWATRIDNDEFQTRKKAKKKNIIFLDSRKFCCSKTGQRFCSITQSKTSLNYKQSTCDHAEKYTLSKSCRETILNRAHGDYPATTECSSFKLNTKLNTKTRNNTKWCLTSLRFWTQTFEASGPATRPPIRDNVLRHLRFDRRVCLLVLLSAFSLFGHTSVGPQKTSRKIRKRTNHWREFQ